MTQVAWGGIEQPFVSTSLRRSTTEWMCDAAMIEGYLG